MRWRNKRGFTIKEMLVVIAVIVFAVTLVIGIFIKEIRRPHPVRQTASVLEMFLRNYRGQHDEWPFQLNDLEKDTDNDYIYRVTGEKNAVVFEKMFKSETTYFDPSALLTRINGERMTVLKALKKGHTSIPVGYTLSTDTNEFRFFTVTYDLSTDCVSVSN